MHVANTATLANFSTSSGMSPLRVLHAIRTGLGRVSNLHGHSFMVKINVEMLESVPPMGVLLLDYNNTDSFDHYYAMQYSST